jgi:hypothetical protein
MHRVIGRSLSWTFASAAWVIVLAGVFGTANAQIVTPKDEIFGGYSWLFPNGWGGQDYKINNIPNAFDVSNSYYLGHARNWGLVVDGSAHLNGSTTPPNLANGANDATGVGYALGGVQYKFRGERWSPFVRGLLGVANISPDCCHGMEWSFAFGGGGGLDLTLSRRFSIRLIQADYIYSNYSRDAAIDQATFGHEPSSPTSQMASVDHPSQWNSVRLAAGVVFNLGGYPSQDGSVGTPASPPAPSGKQTGQRKHAKSEGASAYLDTLSTSVSTVITSAQLRSLPLFNRNFLAVGLLAPSTHDVPAWSELKDTTFSVSGQRPTQNAFLLDGMENVASSSNQAIPFQVNDAVREFRVTTATADAQFGRNIGGTVNIITQRGTAKFHGSVFGFFADSSMNASSPLSVYGGSGFSQAQAFAGSVNSGPASNTNPQYSPIYQPSTYNQYVSTIAALNSNYGTSYCAAPGAQYGTPSCLQRFDPNAVLSQQDSHTQPFSSQQFGAQAGGSFLKRWYWFGDYEGTRIDNPNPIFERVPSSYDRSHLPQFSSQPGYADAAFAQAVLSLYPQSNVQAIPDVLEFYRGQAPNYTNVDNYLGRLDFTQSDRTDWTFRYNLQNLSQLHDDSLPASSTYPGNGAQRAVLNQNLVGTFTHRFSDSLTNVARGGFTQFQVKETPQDANFDPSQIGLPSGAMRTYFLSGLDPQYAGAATGTNGAWGGWYESVWSPPSQTPIITPSLDGLFPFARIGAPLSAPGMRQDRELQFTDNLVWFKGKHTVRTGVDVRWLHNVFNNGGYSRGMVVSGDIGEFTSDSETCVSCPKKTGAFTKPSFEYALQQPTPYDTAFHSYAIGVYVQDSWRLRPNLTINAGLRYEYFSPNKEVNRQIWNYDPEANGLIQEGGTQVLDPYGTVCGAKTVGWYSVYGATIGLPWICNKTGNSNFLVANTTNFEPRVGVAWSTPSGNTVIRAGFGIFYDQLPASLTAQLAFNRPVPYSTTTPQAIYDQNYFRGNRCRGQQCGLGNTSLLGTAQLSSFNQVASIPFGLSAIDPKHFDNPLTRQVSFSIGRQIGRNTTAEVSYIGNYVANLPTRANTGFNNEWFCTSSAEGHLSQPCDAFSYLPIFTLANSGYGNYNALVANLTVKEGHGFQTRVSYTYSKALDNASEAGSPLVPGTLMTQLSSLNFYGVASPLKYALGTNSNAFQPPSGVFGPGAVAANFSALTNLLTAGVSTTGAGRVVATPYLLPQDPYNFLRNDYGRSDFDQTNRFIVEYTWDIPTSSRSRWLTGWMMSGVFIAQSGQPFTIFAGPIAGELNQRVNLTGPLTMTGNPRGYIGNTSAIALPGASCETQPGALSPFVLQSSDGIRAGSVGTPCLGNSGRNQFTGPAYVDYDMAIQKLFKLHETLSLSLRAESYNLFNHPNYYNPVSAYSLDGVTQYSQFGQIESAHNVRQFQFGVRLSW